MIPYNPSSFNSNKTILEQILELKNWLINNPSYQVYSSSESGQTLAYNGYLISALADPTNIGVGDVVVFSNSTLGSVVSVDTDSGTFGCGPCISFKGDTGATGSDGNSFKVTTDNYVNDSTAYSRANVEPVHSVQVGDVILFANDYVGYITSVSGVNFYVTRTQSVKGEGLEQIKLTSQTGTLTADELVIAEKESTYVYFETPTVNYDLRYLQQNSLYIQYGSVYLLGNNLYVLDLQITKSTGAYNLTTNLKPIKATSIDSETATSGQVLTADGSGNASWQTPSTPSIEGSSILSTGILSGKVLTADGSGGASWEDAGGFDVITITTTTGNFSASDITKLQKENTRLIYNNIVYTKTSYSGTTLYYKGTYIGSGYVRYESVFVITISNGYYTRQTAPLTSDTATVGQVLTADGYGGSSWQNAGGGGLDVVNITSISGTFSQDDFDKLSANNAIITETSGNNVYVYYKSSTDSNYIKYACDFKDYIGYITINKFTRAYSYSSSKIEGANIGSTGATSGQVLTANGSGNATWQTPSRKYQHNIRLIQSSGYNFTMSIINNDATPYSTASDCINAIANYMANATQNGSSSTKTFVAIGYNGSISINNMIIRAMYLNNQIQVYTNSGNVVVDPSDTIATWDDSVVAL